MTLEDQNLNSLLKLVLPPEIFEYFIIIKIDTQLSEVHIHLNEKPIKPEGYELVKLISKGFHKPAIIQDFPLRDKALFLHIRRRRWFCESTQKTVERDWETVAKGTHLTKGFATFLKGILGQIPDQQ